MPHVSTRSSETYPTFHQKIEPINGRHNKIGKKPSKQSEIHQMENPACKAVNAGRMGQSYGAAMEAA